MATSEPTTRWWGQKRTWYWALGVSVLLYAGSRPTDDAEVSRQSASQLLIADVSLLVLIVSLLALALLSWRARRHSH